MEPPILWGETLSPRPQASAISWVKQAWARLFLEIQPVGSRHALGLSGLPLRSGPGRVAICGHKVTGPGQQERPVLRNRITPGQSPVRGHCQRETRLTRERVLGTLPSHIHLGTRGCRQGCPHLAWPPSVCPAQWPLARRHHCTDGEPE